MNLKSPTTYNLLYLFFLQIVIVFFCQKKILFFV